MSATPGIPPKLFSRLLDDLCDYLREPTSEHDARLLQTEQEAGWPWSPNGEQILEWSQTYMRFDPPLKGQV